MSKTAVSALQELMAKQRKPIPEYVVITNHATGQNAATFTYKVICGSQSAVGSALSKKEAKQCAAKEMLKLLKSGSSTSTPIQSSPVKTKSIPNDSYYVPGSNSVGAEQIFVNSVGKLNEHCTIQKLLLPQYELSHASGPSHMMVFTIVCSIGPLQAKGTANTKKEAKHKAAQNMLEMLGKNTLLKPSVCKEDCVDNDLDSLENKYENLAILDIQIMEPLKPISETSKKAQNLFPSLCHKKSVKITKNVNVCDYHYAIKASLDVLTRVSILKHLQTVTNMTKRDVLKRITNLMNVAFETNIINVTCGGYMVQYKLDTIPVIIDFGMSTTVLDAEDKAITNFLSSINLLLS